MLKKSILVVHRYLGVFAGVLMTLWCLSGFVMMYQGYPTTTSSETLLALEPLDFRGCCGIPEQQLDELASRGNLRIEARSGQPILVRGLDGSPTSLLTGEALPSPGEAQLLQAAREFVRGNGLSGEPRIEGVVDVDQWTIQTARRNAPVYKVVLDDAAGTELYLSGSTGEVFQDTNRRERILTWLGAIPHWLYPLELRRNGALWSGVVIWTSLIGTFLTLTGIYVGVTSLRRRSTDGRVVSPFRGWWYWHHMTGLFFGVLVLTWVFSGLLTMSPWGWLAGNADMFRYRNALIGEPAPSDTRRFLDSLPALGATDYVRLETGSFNGTFHALATRRDGTRQRLNVQGNPAILDAAEVQAALGGLSVGVSDFVHMTEEDQYHYAYKGNTATLPVYRAILDDDEQTRLYIDPATGSIATVNANDRLNRWTRVGLHRLDFSFMKARPVWDLVVIFLLAGVTLVCITGTWMSFRRIKLDWQLGRKRLARLRQSRAAQGKKVSCS